MSKQLLADLMMQAPYQPATNYWRSVELQHVIQHGFPVGRGLDLGCGDGHLMDIILRQVGHRELVGLDLDPEETRIARVRNMYQDVVSAPGDRMPFQDGSFDYVFSNSVLEHIPEIDGVLAEVRRVLRAGGRFIFTVPGPDFHGCLRGPKFGDREKYLRSVDARCAHLRYWDLSEWSQHLNNAGLRLVQQHSYLTRTQVQRWELIARYTSGPLYRLARGKKQPIEIQRTFRLRSPRIHLPRGLARAVTSFIMLGENGNAAPLFGCLLIEARKP